MKLVTYNLHFGGKTSARNHWQRLVEEFEPDFILAQESFHPSRYLDADNLANFADSLHRNVDHGKWGSAVLSRSHVLEEVSLGIPIFEGWVICARAHNVRVGSDLNSILFINVHAPSRGNYEALVMQLLDAIEEKFGAENKIIAGDFNLTTAYRQLGETIKNTSGELAILERMQGKLGLINAWQFLHPQEPLPQTLRWSNKPLEPYHCDGIFVSKTLLHHLQQAEVICHGDWATLSDHNPIVATFL